MFHIWLDFLNVSIFSLHENIYIFLLSCICQIATLSVIINLFTGVALFRVSLASCSRCKGESPRGLQKWWPRFSAVSQTSSVSPRLNVPLLMSTSIGNKLRFSSQQWIGYCARCSGSGASVSAAWAPAWWMRERSPLIHPPALRAP